MPDRTFRPSANTDAETKYLIFAFLSKAIATLLALLIAIIWVGPFLQMVVTSLKPNFPVTVGMLKLNSDRYMSAFNLPSAGLVISQIPIIILFLILYRRFAGGKLAGAVKG